MTFAGAAVPILPKSGLNNSDPKVNIKDGQSPDCLNVRFSSRGVEKRDGISKYHDDAISADPVVGIAELATDDGNSYQLAVSGSVIAMSNGASWDDITGAVSLTSDADNLVRTAQLGNVLVGTNNVDALWKFTGTGNAAALGGSPPSKAVDVVEYKNYLFLGNIEETGTRTRGKVRWSAINNVESWPAANINTIKDQTGDEFKAFAKAGDQLYCFFGRSIQQAVYTGQYDVPFQFPTAHPSIGTVSTHGIVEADGMLFFPSYRGIYVFNGAAVKYLSEDIEGTWRSINPNRLSKIVGVLNEKHNEIWWACATLSSVQNDTIIVFNYSLNNWTIYKLGVKPNMLGLYFDDNPLAPIMGSYGGTVYEGNTEAYNDDTAAIRSYVDTKPTNFGTPAAKKTVLEVQIVADSQTADGAIIEVATAYDLASFGTELEIDVEGAGAKWGEAVWDVDVWPGSGLKIGRTRPNGHGTYFQARFENSQEDVAMKISEAHAFVRGRVGQ